MILNKEACPKRKKPESDVDYLPDEDMADTEDDRLELEAVVEKPSKVIIFEATVT